MKHIEQMIEKIESIDSKKGLNDFFQEVGKTFHYAWSGLVVFEPSSSKHFIPKFFGDVPAGLRTFIGQDDNIKRYCLNESKPADYRKLLLEKKALIPSNETEGIFSPEECQLVIPVNGLGSEFACLIFSMPQQLMEEKILEKLGWYWVMLSPFIYSRYRKKVMEQVTKMTKRELECIKWASEGKTSWEISQLLTISQRTVDFHLANCIAKTDSINRQQAVVKCILHGHLLAV
ncbi:helix-turn-helix transcriptional regulator [Thalassomonas sp. RHCl1]|uniref:helix-turn-helix transcriptional regulator n=1 Tax=Thalassomonas sp. RHCl1 TaxID=2995320 RepID=UPI00248B864E|nr:helix-turn-helix transcriptional regulator [Thalassomonas sp. RHCl1]